MFIDRAKITVKSGKGGDGCIAFHHEKFIERGVLQEEMEVVADQSILKLQMLNQL